MNVSAGSRIRKSERNRLGREAVPKSFRPFDSDNPILLKVFVKAHSKKIGRAFHSIQIEMIEASFPFFVKIEVGKSRALDWRLNVESCCETLHERCFPGSERSV